jgi:D-psicose/D-tagatose/L-ribulose 3-epimerase
MELRVHAFETLAVDPSTNRRATIVMSGSPISIGVSTWIWYSPLKDALLSEIAPRVRAWGFDSIELPVETETDWDPVRAAALLSGLGLGATTCAVMSGGRDLTTADSAVTTAAQAYLRGCVDAAQAVGSAVVAGPMYAPVGRVWRMDGPDRGRTVNRLIEGLRPVIEYAGDRGVTLALEPLNRFETSLMNTVEQAMEVVERVDSPALGVCLDTFHMNIEEKDPSAAVRQAGRRIAHVQACGTDRGTPGEDQFGWSGFVDALVETGYRGHVSIESFTGDNDAIARAASIWRRLAPSQDRLATDGLAFLRSIFDRAGAAVPTAGDRHVAPS